MAAVLPDVPEPEPKLSIARSLSLASEGEPEALLRERLAGFARLLAGLFSVTYAGGIVIILAIRPSYLLESFLLPARVANLVEIALLALCAWLLKRRAFSRVRLQVADVLIAVGVAWPMTLGLFLMQLGYTVMFGAVLVVLVMLALRAAFVPSPPGRTALTGALCTSLLVVLVYAQAKRDPALPEWLTPGALAFGVCMWSGATTAATTVTSRIIYGLHAEVREALRLGQYTLLEKLGEGGMGRVYLARHALLRRPTAVKLLLPGRAGPSELARFEREVQLTSGLTHPNTIAIYDYGRTTSGVFYYAMEYVDGLSIEELVRQYGAQPPARVTHVLRQVAGALAEAHGNGLIHRDVKPANILLSDRGGVADLVKVVDFGLVKEVHARTSVTVTLADAITGTPAYLAPEMITAPEAVGPPADLYALGAVGYFMLTGFLVFDGRTIVEICGHHLHTVPTPPSQRSNRPIPEGLERLILRCLEKSPESRPASAAALEAALGELAGLAPASTADAARWWSEYRSQRPNRPTTNV